jgi:hypothetical protein
VNRVFLTIPANDDAHSSEAGRVNGISRGGQIERRLDEAAVILQTNIASHAQIVAAIYHAVRYGGLGDPAHDLVADTTPLGAQLGDKAFIGKVVDQHGSTLRQELEIAQGDRAEQPHIANTSWGGGCSRKISVRSSAGRRFDGAPLKSDKTVSRAILFAGRASGRHCCTGLTTAARSEQSTRVDDVVVLLTNSMT